MRVLSVTVQGAAARSARHARRSCPTSIALDDYTASQLLGGALRAGGSNGVVYDSVRHDGGKCVGVFRPPRALAAAASGSICATCGTAPDLECSRSVSVVETS